MIKEFYEKYPYPPLQYVPLVEVHKKPILENLLVVGCGVTQPYYEKSSNGFNSYTFVDISRTSLDIAKILVGNDSTCEFLELDFNQPYQFDNKFSRISCCGVIHHNPEPNQMIQNLSSNLQQDGAVLVMVYRQCPDREVIKPAYEKFKELNYTVSDVMDYFNNNPNDLAKSWYDKHSKSKVEIADTWLNPYYKDYTEEELDTLMLSSGLKSVGYMPSLPTQIGKIYVK